MLTCSVITVTYKDPSGLARTFRSLRDMAAASIQWEWVVVDSSPEVNQEIIAEARRAHLPLSYFTSPPRGIYPAMQLGCAEAKGDCVWFLNGGDELLSPEALSLNAKKLLAEGADLLWAPVQLVEDGELVQMQWPRKDVRSRLYGVNRVCHQGLLYSKRAFKSLQFKSELKLVADYVHLLQCEQAGMKFTNGDEPIARFHLGGSSDQVTRALREFWMVHWHNLSDMAPSARLRHIIYWVILGSITLLKKQVRSLPAGARMRRLYHSLKNSTFAP